MSIKNRILYMCLLISVYFLAFPIHAATTWTQSEGYYHWYKAGTLNKYALSTNIEVSTSWVKQDGTYIQCVSSGGSKKYWPQGYDCSGKQVVVVPTCQAFVCNDAFGWVFDMSKNTVLTCPMVKIDKGVAQIYDGLQSIDGVPTCR